MKKESSTKEIAKDTQMTSQFIRLCQAWHEMPTEVTLPTQWQLADLAAKLATGREQEYGEILKLSEKALELWEAAGVTLEEAHPIRREMSSLADTLEQRFPRKDIPEGKMGRDEAMKRLLPKKKEGDRAKLLRTFLEENIRANTLCYAVDFLLPREENQSTEELVEIAMEALRENGFTRWNFYSFGESFLNWHKTYSARTRSETNRNNRLSKKKVLTPENG